MRETSRCPSSTSTGSEGRSDEQKAEIAKRIEAALVEVAGAAPEHCWVKFSDSKRTDFIIGESVED